MQKRVVDLTAEQLDKIAGEAWSAASETALAKDLPVTGSRGEQRFRVYPDGRTELLGPVHALPETGEDRAGDDAARAAVRQSRQPAR
jgi:hypothetical protein